MVYRVPACVDMMMMMMMMCGLPKKRLCVLERNVLNVFFFSRYYDNVLVSRFSQFHPRVSCQHIYPCASSSSVHTSELQSTLPAFFFPG